MQSELGKVKKIHHKKIYSNKLIIIFKFFLTLSPLSLSIVVVSGVFLFAYVVPYFFHISNKLDLTSVSVSESVLGASIEAPHIEGYGLTDNQVSYEQPSSTIKTEDKRIYVLDQYYKSRNSPLYGYAKYFVDACDKFGAPKDCITTTAIARHETDLCNYSTSALNHNCMGWGGAGEHRIQYNSFEEHIYTATDVLVNQYGPNYMDDPRLMEKVFCGPQEECIGWGNRVLHFMREIDDFSESLGVGRLTDLRGDGKRY